MIEGSAAPDGIAKATQHVRIVLPAANNLNRRPGRPAKISGDALEMAQGAVRTGDRRVWKPDQEAFGFDQGSPDDRTEGITESIQVNLITLEQRAGYVSRSLLLIDAIGAQRSTRACQSSPDRV
ncbi:MAG: hypothetical protein ACUVSY_19110, partial [Roseiflexus sp.]